MAYTPPVYTAVNFDGAAPAYSAPAYTAVNFDSGLADGVAEGGDTAFDLMFAAVTPPDIRSVEEGSATALDTAQASALLLASQVELSVSAADTTNAFFAREAAMAEGSATANDLQNATIDPFVPQYEDIFPIADVSGAWTPSVVGAAHWDMVNETPPADFTDYLRSPPNPTTEPEELRFAPLPDYQGNDRFFSVELALEAVNFDCVFDFELRESATVLDSWSETVTLAQGQVVRTHAFDEAVIALISNRADVRIHMVAHP